MKGNIIGDSFDKYVREQIKVRQEIYGSKQRTPQQLSYLNGKQAFVRLISSVDIVGEEGREKLNQFGFSNPEIYMGSQLAKNFILHAGSSVYDEFGVPTKESLRKGINFTKDPYPVNSAYGIGGTDFGLQPMPTLGDVDIKYRNRGSLREANLTIKCFNPKQFEIIDTLYLRLGYTLLLEWGNSIYFDNKKEYISNNFYNSLQGYMFDEGNKDDQLKLLQSIEKLRFDSNGNYDALFGKVANYNWNFENGVYNINLKLISLGDIIESLKLGFTTPKPNSEKNNKIEKSNSDSKEPETEIDLLTTYKNSNDISLLLYTAASSTETEEPIILNKGIPFLNTTPPPQITQNINNESDDSNEALNNDLYYGFEEPTIGPSDTVTGQTEGLRQITEAGIAQTIPRPFTVKSYSLKYIAEKIGFESSIPFGFIELENRITNSSQKKFITESTKDFIKLGQKTSENDNKFGTYIRFGALLEFIEKTQCLYNPNIKTNSSLLFIDYNPSNNYMISNDLIISSNPFVCLVGGGDKILDWNFEGNQSDPFDFLAKYKEEVEGEVLGKIMNIYLSASYLINLMVSLEDGEGEILLFPFISSICKDINNSLGNLSSIIPFIDETTNTLKILEENIFPNNDKILEKITGKSKETVNLDLFGYDNFDTLTPTSGFIKNFGIKTEITNDLATTISIGAQANGLTPKYDGTVFSYWNRGLEDRLISQKSSLPVSSSFPSLEKKYEISLQNYQSLLFDSTTLFFNREEIQSYKTGLKGVISYKKELIIQGKEKPITGPSFLPINLNIILDGISGLKIYQSFSTNSKFLPYPLPESLEFLIKGVSHKISSNIWTTTIDSLSIPLSSEVRVNSKKESTKNNTTPLSNQQNTPRPTAADSIIKNQSSTNTERKPIEEINVENGIAIDIIKAFEKFESKPYLDANQPGVWTIGYGTIKINGKRVTGNTPPITEIQATQYLLSDVQVFINSLKKGLNGLEFTQNEFDALLSLTYNVGPAWTSSTSSTMRRLLFNGDYLAAADEIRTWKWASGTVNQGLVNRREAERTLFLTNFPGNPN